MLARIPPAQRRLVVLVAAAAVAAGVSVGVAVVLASGQPAVRPDRYEPFVTGHAARLGELIATDQPLFFADPTGGIRGFALALEDGDFVAVHVIPPGGSADCPIDWDPTADRFEDCHGKVWATRELRRFPTRLSEDDLVVVDIRRLDPAPALSSG